MNNTMNRSSFIIFGYMLFIIFFLEIILRISIMRLTVDINLLRIFLFSASYALFGLFLFRFLKPKYIKILFLLFVVILSILYFAQDMYFRIFNSFFSFAITGDAILGVTFLGRFIHKVELFHLLYLLPVLATVVLIKSQRKNSRRVYYIRYRKVYQPLLVVGFALVLSFVSRVTIPKESIVSDESEYNYSDYDLYNEPYSPYLAIKKFGLFTYVRIDLESNLESDEPVNEIESEIETFLNQLPEHTDNDYTGVLEGKNLILIMAESLDTYALDPLVMPNLMDLLDNSWYFENYYSPLYYRNTADTEFMTQTSFLPHNGVELSMEAFEENEFIYTLPKMFHEDAYNTYSFHDYTDYFYPRTVFHPITLGYDQYFGAVEMGLLEEPDGFISDHAWPSDTLMMEQVIENTNFEESFFTYILTVSGHLPYDQTDEIALNNYDTIVSLFTEAGRELPEESILYYLAAQYEFDKSIKTLIDGLTAAGELEDTVIMIYGDHYAYGLDLEDIWSYDTVKEDFSTIDIHNVPFILYNPSLEPMVIPNTMSSLDIIPTIANLFDLTIDYHKIMGSDALDDISNVVQFSNGSIRSDDFEYNIETDIYTFYNEATSLEEAYILNNYMIHKKQISNYILENNYFYIERTAVIFINDEKKIF